MLYGTYIATLKEAVLLVVSGVRKRLFIFRNRKASFLRVYNKVCKLEKVAYTLFNLGEV